MFIKNASESTFSEGLETPIIGKRLFYYFSNYRFEYICNVKPEKELLINLKSRGVDLFSFIQRTFCEESFDYPFRRDYENIAVMKIDSFEVWWAKTIRKKERQSVKKAQKCGIEVRNVELNDAFFKGVQRIYNETQFREGRRYSGYGLSLEHLRGKFENVGDSEMLGAYLDGQLIGILWLAFGDKAAMFRSFVSLVRERDKCPNNALIARAVRRCSERKIGFLVYGNHYGFLPSLDLFREHQGFRRVSVPRYYVPLSRAGQLALKFGIHRKLEYCLPRAVERAFLKLYNPVSRITPTSIWWRLGGE
jgi:hypothetical protein